MERSNLASAHIGRALNMNTAARDFRTSHGMLLALQNTGVSVLWQDSDLRIVQARNVPAVWRRGDLTGLTDIELFPEEVAQRVAEAKLAVLRGEAPARLEISLDEADGARWFEIWIDAERHEDDEIVGIVTTAVETTDQKRREQTLRTLLREVSHRSKNLLAIIQSIATQTGRYSVSIDGFLTRFRGRIQSLASSQDLVTSSNWRGAHLQELIVGQAARYCPSPQTAIRFEGVRLWLNPNAALHVGLALHELTVNSVSFGALSKAGGYVSVAAALGPEGSGDALSLTWSEILSEANNGAQHDEEMREKRFGSVALERVVPAALNGSATLDFSNGRLVYSLAVPGGNFEVE